MEENKISELMDVTMSKIKQLVDTNTIIGTPINTPDGITIIPVSRVSFGFGSGGGSGKGNSSRGTGYMGGNGAGVKVEPIGFLIVKDGACRMMNISVPAGTTVDRIVEMVPDIIDKIESVVEKHSSPKE